jgi:predicted DNA-binding transcriptional regulator YafY
MRADRLLSILLLLQEHGRLTAGQLAEKLEVSVRTVYRDMEALGAAGVPIVAERGMGGGWELMGGYETDLTGLTQSEIRSLFLSGSSQHASDLGLHDAAEGALLKLFAAVPSAFRRDAEFVRRHIHIDAAGWRPSSESQPFLTALQDAIWQQCKIRLTYRRSDGTEVERLVDPLGLVAKRTIWYLVAAVGEDIRTYRVSRVTNVRATPLRADTPPGFDLATYWEQSSADFVAALPRYTVEIRADPEILPRLRYAGRFSRIEHVGEPDDEGWLPVTIRFETEDDARECLLGFGPTVEVLEPYSLRLEILRHAEETVRFYRRGDRGDTFGDPPIAEFGGPARRTDDLRPELAFAGPTA